MEVGGREEERDGLHTRIGDGREEKGSTNSTRSRANKSSSFSFSFLFLFLAIFLFPSGFSFLLFEI